MKQKLKKIGLGAVVLGLALAGTSAVNNSLSMRSEDPRIALNRRGAFVPIVNDVLYRVINPFGYDKQSKLKQFVPNLIFGRNHKVPEREDAWRLYLGKPQASNTFSISEYSPEGSKEDCYKIKDFFDRYLAFGRPEDQIKILDGIAQAGGKITSGDFDVMGGYHMGISKDENGKTFLYYHDVWDLNVPLERNGGFFGKPFTIYDRLYFDEKTYQPKRPIKPVRDINDLERM